jgi:hypothetical protein
VPEGISDTILGPFKFPLCVERWRTIKADLPARACYPSGYINPSDAEDPLRGSLGLIRKTAAGSTIRADGKLFADLSLERGSG